MPTLTGFENHGGTAVCGPGARPLARIVTGVGNGDHRSEGAVQGNIVATYLHGPVLIRNPALADLLLSRVLGGDLPAFDDAAVERLRAERLDAADPRRHRTGRALVGDGRRVSAPERRSRARSPRHPGVRPSPKGSVMTEYVVMFPADNEAELGVPHRGRPSGHLRHRLRVRPAARGAWRRRDRRRRAHRTAARHGRSGADHTRTSLVTDGPFAESVEQLSGFFIVTCDEYDALVEAAQVLVRAHPVVEIRPVQEF